MFNLKPLVLLLFITVISYAQVGIGTFSPTADLEIMANPTPATGEFNGIIIPKVAAIPSTVAPSGTIVYVTAGAAPGFYFSNGAAYQNVTDILTASGRGAFNETGTTTLATNNTQNIFRTGNVSLGEDFAGVKLYVGSTANNSSPRTTVGVRNLNTSAAAVSTFSLDINNVSLTTGTKYGFRNNVSSSGVGEHVGIQNTVFDSGFASTSVTGIRNEVGATAGVSSVNYGVRSVIGSGASRGTNYAVYAYSQHGAPTTDLSYSGYFRGDNFAIRSEDDSDGYNLPTVSGTAGQVLTANGVNGTATWTTPAAVPVNNDNDANNEGILSVAAGGANDSQVISTNGTNSTNVTIAGGDGIEITENLATRTITVSETENFAVRANYAADFGVTNTAVGTDVNFIRWERLTIPNEITSTTEYTAGTFTASSTGYYNISAHIQSTFSSGTNEDYFGLAIYKNGVRIQATQGRNSQSEDFIRRSVNGLHYLTSGDTIEIYLGFPETLGNFNNIESDNSELIIFKLD